MKRIPVLLAATFFVLAVNFNVLAQPYYAAGEFNGWDPGTTVMNDDGDGTHSLTITYGTSGNYHNWKVTAGTWDNQWPPAFQDVRTKVDPNGMNTVHFRPGVINDGWNPGANRVGYEDPGNMTWEIMGAFNNWDGAVDTAARQMSSTGNGVYTVDYTIATPGTYAFKFRSSNSWDHAIGRLFGNTGDDASVTTTSSNQTVNFQLDLPNGRWVAGEPASAPTNKVSFVVDMAYPIYLYDLNFSDANGFDTNSENLYVRGSFNGFAVSPDAQLFQVPGTTLYSNTVDVVGYTGATIEYKYWKDFASGAYEDPVFSCGANRTLELTGVSPQQAPLVYWSDRMVGLPDVEVTIQVDMSVQQAVGSFDPASGVSVRGTFNDWGETILTNHPAPDTNIFSTVVTFASYPTNATCQHNYKFFNRTPGAGNGGWEEPLTTEGGDRVFSINATMQELPVAYFNDASPCDLIVETNFITFTVDMSEAVETDGNTPYDGTWDVYINGPFIVNGWQGWNTGALASYQLTNTPGTSNYSITLPMPPGQVLRLVYKYGANVGDPSDLDNEALPMQDHVRYIRTTPGMNTYSISDVWTGTNAQNIANLEEAELSLAVSDATSGNVTIDWWGLSCTELEAAPAIDGPWTVVMGAEGVGSTTMQATEDQQYIRLTKPAPGAPASP